MKRPAQELRSKNYFLKKEDDTRLTGVFPIQQLKTLKKLVKRRCIGKPVSTKWIRNDFFITCKQDLPPGFDPSNTSQFGYKWCQNYKRRQGLSVRRRTNRKPVYSNGYIRYTVIMHTVSTIWHLLKYPQRRKSHHRMRKSHPQGKQSHPLKNHLHKHDLLT